MRSLAQARQANLQNNTTSNSQTVTTHVDNLTIHTQATNANDIAANIQQSLQKQGQMVYSADGGLN
jgi:lactam utilization protein B